MCFICRKIIPEVGKIDLFASCDERLRRWPMETKVPHIRVVVGELPAGNAGKKSIHYHELFYFTRELGSISISDHQTDVVSHNAHFGHTERLCQRMNSNGRCLHVEAILRNRGVADSRQVGCDDCEPIRELRNERTPHVGRLRISMQKNDVGTVPGQQVLEFCPFNSTERDLMRPAREWVCSLENPPHSMHSYLLEKKCTPEPHLSVRHTQTLRDGFCWR